MKDLSRSEQALSKNGGEGANVRFVLYSIASRASNRQILREPRYII
jgi:hypothetical protein